MPEIQILSPHLADLIAAGEVVERPASVVKELVENAFDAGARTVTVELRGGGATYLRVTDDGCGMAPEDAGIAFLRHATSKLHDEQGLEAIGTMGFRGEALAAISAVSHITLTTRQRGAASGTHMTLDAGDIQDMYETGCPEGTTMIVRDLFFNTPARRKFLKSDRAEGAACAAAALRCALGRPDVSVRCIRDGEEVFFSPGDNKLDSCVYSLLGRDLAMSLLPCAGEADGVRVHGFLSSPAAGRGSRAQQYFFCNGRWIKSAALQAALEQAYRNTLLVGRFPACVLYVELSCAAVDVNVHPAKTEVKFLNERAVFDAVHYAALSTLSNASGRVAMQMPKSPAPDAQPAAPQQTARPAERPAARPAVNPNFYQTMQAGEYRRQAGAQPRTVLASQVQYPTRTPKPVEPAMPPVEKAPSPIAPPQPEPVVAPVKPAAKAEPEPAAIPKEPIPTPAEPEQLALDLPEQTFRLIGSYLIAEQGESVLFIDKHAAHERILFEKLKAEDHPIVSQELMAPVSAELTREEAATVLENTEILGKCGFEVADFGDGEVLVRQIPCDVDEKDAVSLLQELAADLLAGKTLAPETLRDNLLHTIACKAAIKAGWHTEGAEAAHLVAEILSRTDIKYCPHGRPVCIELTKSQLERQCKRS